MRQKVKVWQKENVQRVYDSKSQFTFISWTEEAKKQGRRGTKK